MKRIVCCVLVLLLSCGALFAAGRKEAPAARAVEPVRLKWAHVYEAFEEYHKWALWAAEEIKRRTNGRYVIEVFPAASLGKESDIVEGLTLGSVHMVYAGAAFIGHTFGPIAMGEAPFMFTGFEHFINYTRSDFFKELVAGYEQASRGHRILSNTYYGARCVTSNRPINTPADMRGLKIRIPNAPLYLMFTEALGAIGTPIAFAEVYLALQQGVVEAQENPLPVIQARRFYEVQRYINLTQHIINNLLTIVSATTWQRLTPEERKIFEEVSLEAARQCSLAITKAEDELGAWFEKQGNIVNKVDRRPFIEVVSPSLRTSPRMTWTLAQFNRMQALRP